jgi:hypothetical protein
LEGVWSAASDQLLHEFHDLSVFFGGYLNNGITTVIIARSHGSTFVGVEEATGTETTLGIASIYSLLAKLGKTDNIVLALSNDYGETNTPLPVPDDTNYIILGGTAQAYELIPKLTNRSIEYIEEEEDGNRYYVIERNFKLKLHHERLSFLIYKSRTGYDRNIIYLFSPWALGSLKAAQTLCEWYQEFVQAEKGNEFLYVFEFTMYDQRPKLTYRHQFAPIMGLSSGS